MPKTVTLQLSPRQSADVELYTALAARELHIRRDQVAMVRVVKRSIDARRSPIKVNLSLELFIDDEQQPAPLHFDYPDVSNAPEVGVVGSGPAGLFASLRLIELGLKPILLERGKEVLPLKRDIALINRNMEIDPDSNYAFGAGGAGKAGGAGAPFPKLHATRLFHFVVSKLCPGTLSSVSRSSKL